MNIFVETFLFLVMCYFIGIGVTTAAEVLL